MGVIRRVAPWCVSRGGYWRFYFPGARGGSNETRALSYSCKESTLVSSASLEGRAFLGSVWRPRLGASAVCFGLRAMCFVAAKSPLPSPRRGEAPPASGAYGANRFPPQIFEPFIMMT